MNRAIRLVGGAGLGAAAMFFLDPDMGRRRRALLRDKIVRARHSSRHGAGVTTRDLNNRIRGWWAEAKSLLRSEYVSDEVLTERVRSHLGFLVRHPSSIEVKATEGRVLLSGPVLADEIDQLLKQISSVRGVREIENRLEIHEEPGNVPGLQGEKPKPTGPKLDVMQNRWSPSTRFMIGASGAMLMILGLSRWKTRGAFYGLNGRGFARTAKWLPRKRSKAPRMMKDWFDALRR